MNSNQVLNIVTIAMFLVTAVILGLFIFGGSIPNQIYDTPVYTATILNWSYILFVIAIIAAVIFPMARLVTRPKQAMKSFLGLAALVVLVLVAYGMSDGTPMKITGYTGPDNVESMLKFSDTILFTMYFLFAGAILAIAGTEIYRRIK